jgi:hypothetical protein
MVKFLLIFLLGLSLDASAASAAPNDAQGVAAMSSNIFLDSLGVNTHVDQGYNAESYVAPLRYLGVRNTRDGGRNIAGDIMLHQRTGIRVDLLATMEALDTSAKSLAAAGALLSLEGPNEPNNFPITYNGEKGGGTQSWKPVAEFQRDFYAKIKGDPALKLYPVFHVSEGGAETDNVGLQFLIIPAGAKTLFPDGTRYADYANPHNYVSSTSSRYVDNQAWQAADPTLNSHWDGLYVEYGKTWRGQFQGYSNAQLQSLPRVTTETGWDSVKNPGGEKVQGAVLVNTYLAQFKRGWRYTFIYELGDNEGGAGNQGLFRQDWQPKPAATYIHNLTSILADTAPAVSPGKLNYSIANEPATVHDLLLQKSNRAFELIVWGEQVNGSNNVTVNFGSPRATVKIYDLTAGTQPVQILNNVSHVPLNIADHALIVEILP